MLALVAPEPADWVAPALAALALDDERVIAFAPWAGDRWSTHRQAWQASDLALRAWSRRGVDQRMRGRVVRRAAADRWAAHRLPQGVAAVIAPSLGARRTFAAARSRGIRTVLVEDLPGLRELHADLDAAAERWPDSSFLRRFRAPAPWIAAQEAERVLADLLVVTSAHAATRSPPSARVVELDLGAGRVNGEHRYREPARRVLLAGPAVARNGTNEALAALDALPSLTLLVRPAEGTEPVALLRHGRVKVATAAEHDRLDGVDVVLAPSWCEGRFRQVERAADFGLPVVATSRAAGFVAAHLVEPGDIAAIVTALGAPVGPARRRTPERPLTRCCIDRL